MVDSEDEVDIEPDEYFEIALVGVFGKKKRKHFRCYFLDLSDTNELRIRTGVGLTPSDISARYWKADRNIARYCMNLQDVRFELPDSDLEQWAQARNIDLEYVQWVADSGFKSVFFCPIGTEDGEFNCVFVIESKLSLAEANFEDKKTEEYIGAMAIDLGTRIGLITDL